MARRKKKTLMRSLGEFFGHIVKAAKTDPARHVQSEAKPGKVVRKAVEEKREGTVVLRRTTIEEIEVRKNLDEE
jgi:hypothetical protein